MSDKSKPEILPVRPDQVAEFWNTFVNRKAYVQQTEVPGAKSGKHQYYRPEVKATKEPIPLRPDTIAAHLAGWLTLAFYAIKPAPANNCKWLAIDADYGTAKNDLEKLREAFAVDGIEALPESSRRGGHLWVFNEEPLPAGLLRLYVLNKAKVLGVPVKAKGDDDGIEVFPKQDALGEGEFGNAIRAPFGIHRATNQRYWFEGAEQNIDAQLALIRSAQRLSLAHLEELTADLKPIDVPKPKFQPKPAFYRGNNSNLVVVALGPHRRSGKNYVAACPVCDSGNSRRDFHLSVKIDDPTVYHCWHQCSSDEIKRALGVDSRERLQFAA
jgi:hypothetical protein